MTHSHSPKVLEWSINEAHDFYASLFGCLTCSETFVSIPLEEESLGHTHTEYVDGCFGCKIQTLQLSTGDANSSNAMASKKWDSENEFFASAVSQGIMPSGVFRSEVEAALDASEILGKPYNGDGMLPAEQITPKIAEVMKELDSPE